MAKRDKYPSISIDTYDLVVIAAMIGGFSTGNWLPFTLFIIWEFIVRWSTKDD
jgi:hypothetical protein